MSKYNKNVKNNYFNTSWGFLTNYGNNVVLLGNTYSSDVGGRVRNSQTYSSGSYSPDTSVDYSVMMASGNMLTVGGNYSVPNLEWVGSWVQGDGAAVRWNGSGLLNFTAHTGGDILGTAEADANSQVSDVGILIHVSNSMPKAYDFNATNMAAPVQNISAYGFKADGNLRLVTDMSAEINVESGANSSNVMRGYYTVSGTTTTYTDLSSNNVVETAALKAESITFDNNFTGLINVSSELDAYGYANANASSNTVTAVGVSASGSVELTDGYWGGVINAKTEGNLIYGDFNFMKVTSDSGFNASVTGNKISALGISGETVTIKDFTGEIYTTARDNHFVAAANAKQTPTCTVTGNEITSVGIKASTLNVTGDFSGKIQVENSNISQSSTGGTLTASGNAATAYGIESITLEVDGSLRGNIEVVTNNIKLLASSNNTYTIAASAIKTNTITVDGYIDTDIVMSCVGNVQAIAIGKMTAQAFTGTIDVDTSVGTSDGIFVSNGITNDNDGVFDMAGKISVSKGGIWGFSQAVSMRVSGEIYAGAYAIVAGDFVGNSITMTGRNDFLEVAAGAVIVGDIDLTDMENTMYVDSNARIEGIISSSGGKLNLTFMLNDNAMSGVTAANGNSVITSGNRSDAALASTTSITINLNDVKLDGNQPKTYYLVNDNSSDWLNRQIAFVYQNKMVYAKVGDTVTSSDGAFKVRSEYTHDKGFFVVVEELNKSNACVTPAGVAHTVEADKNSVTVSWSAVAASNLEFSPVGYELEYRIIDVNGDVGNSITVMLDADTTSFKLTDILEGQKVEYRVRTQYNEYRSFSDWSDEFQVVMDAFETPVASDKAKLEYANPENASSTSSSVMELSWSGFEIPDGLDHYEVEYYIQDKAFADEAEVQANWDRLAFGTGERYYHKYTTAREIIVSGLNDSDYIYWRVRAVDINGNASDWANGDAFQVTLGDNKDPMMSQFEVVVNWDITKDPDQDGFIIATADWSGYDPAGGSGVRFYYVRYRAQQVDENGRPVSDSQGNAVWGEWSEYHKFSSDTLKNDFLLKNGNYQWEVYCTDFAGRASGALSYTTGTDWTAPSVSASCSVSYNTNLAPEEDGFVTARLNWQGSDNSDGVGLEYYEVRYRKKTPAENGSGYTYGEWSEPVLFEKDVLSHSFELPNGEYDWEIVSIDYAGNRSEVFVLDVAGDVVGPEFSNSNSNFTLSWDAANAELVVVGSWYAATDEGSGLLGYRLSYHKLNDVSSEWITIDYAPDVTHTRLTIANGEYEWRLEAIDYAGNITVLPDNRNWVGDVTAPVFSDPDYLFSLVREDENGQKVIDFEWSVAHDVRTAITTGFSHYELVVEADTDGDGKLDEVLREKINGQYMTDFTLTPELSQKIFATNQRYSWHVEAFDIGGNMAAASNSNFVIDYTAPEGSFEDESNTSIRCIWSTRWVEDDFGEMVQEDYISDITITLDFDADFTDDLSGVRYQVQLCADPRFSGPTLKNFYVDTTNMIFDAGNGSATGHLNAGELLGMGQFYWRVRAVDGSGNASDVWFLGDNGNPTILQDENRLNEHKYPTPIVDTTAPSFDSSKEVYFAWNMDGGLYISWDGASDAFGIKQYHLILSRTTAYPDDMSLEEFDSRDDSYANVGSIQRYTANSYYITTKNGNNWVALDNLPDGIYSLNIAAIDYAGNVSESWTQLEDSVTIDVHAPTLDTTSVKAHVAASDVLFTWNAAKDLVGVSQYKLTYKKLNESTMKYEKVQTITIAGTATSFWLYNLEAGEYTFTLQAFDTREQGSNIYGNGSDISDSTSFVIDSVDAGNSFSQAKAMDVNMVYENAVSHADTADYYSLDLTGNSKVTFTVSGVSTLGSSYYGGVTLTWYNSARQVVATDYLGSGSRTYNYSWGAGRYYVAVTPYVASSSVNYSLSMNNSLYPVPTTNDDAANFNNNTLVASKLVDNADGSAGALALNGWVGYGDAEDYFAISATDPGKTTISISNITALTNVRLYNKNKQLLRNINLSSSGTLYTGYLNEVYYVAVSSADNGLGTYNSNYTININSQYVPGDAVPNDTLEQAAAAAVALLPTQTVTGWVGTDDAADIYKFTYGGSEKVSMSISDVSANLVVTVYNDYGYALWRGYANSSMNCFTDLAISGNFYVEVYSYDGGASQCSNYKLVINSDVPAPVVPGSGKDALGFAGAFDGGVADMLLTENEGKVVISKNNSTWAEFDFGSDWQVAGVGDFNGDGKSDMLRTSQSGAVIVDFSYGNGVFESQVVNMLADGWSLEGTGDFNGDGKSDVLVANPTVSPEIGLFGYWKNGTEWVLIDGYSQEWDVKAIGDYNGDGKSDILWSKEFIGLDGFTHNAYCAWVVDDANSWRLLSSARADEWEVLCSGDFNGDGTDDIAMLREADGVVGIWSVKDGSIESWTILSAVDTTKWDLLTVGDFNGDGTDDIAWSCSENGAAGYWQIKNKQLESWQTLA